MGMVLLLVVALNDVLECRFNIAVRGAAAAIIYVLQMISNGKLMAVIVPDRGWRMFTAKVAGTFECR